MGYDKSPWIAAFMNFIFWGSGYVYIKGKSILGIGLLFTSIVNIAIMISIPENVLLANSELFFMWFSFIWVVLSFTFSIDVYFETKKLNAI